VNRRARPLEVFPLHLLPDPPDRQAGANPSPKPRQAVPDSNGDVIGCRECDSNETYGEDKPSEAPSNADISNDLSHNGGSLVSILPGASEISEAAAIDGNDVLYEGVGEWGERFAEWKGGYTEGKTD